MLCHEAADAGHRTVLAQTHDLAIALDAVILESLQRRGLVHPLGLLGLGVHLLLAFLAPAPQAQYEMQRALLLDVVIRQRPAVLELLPGKDESLLIGGDALLVLYFGLHVVDGVRRLDIEGNCFTCIGLYIYT